jgi:hypothetical protein
MADAVIGTAPRTDGRHEHVAEKLDPEPVAFLFLQPVITTLAALKVTFEATLTLTVITTGVR